MRASSSSAYNTIYMQDKVDKGVDVKVEHAAPCAREGTKYRHQLT